MSIYTRERVCHECGETIADRDSLATDTKGNDYHLSCVGDRELMNDTSWKTGHRREVK